MLNMKNKICAKQDCELMGIGWDETAKIFQMTGINHDVLKINRRSRKLDERTTLIRKRERKIGRPLPEAFGYC